MIKTAVIMAAGMGTRFGKYTEMRQLLLLIFQYLECWEYIIMAYVK